MHLSRLWLCIIVSFFVAQQSYSQSSGFGSDLDIILEDNAPKNKKTTPETEAPQYDEEFKSGEITEEQKVDQEMQEAQKIEEQPTNAEQKADAIKREEVPLQGNENQRLETELEKTPTQQQKLPEEQVEELNFGSSPQEQIETPAEAPGLPPVENQPTLPEELTTEPMFTNEPQKEEEPTNDLEEAYDESQEQQALEQQQKIEPDEPVVEIEPDEPPAPKPRRVSKPLAPLKQEKLYSKEELERISEETKVDIEDTDYIPGTKTLGKADILKPFKERRPSWTSKFEVMYSMYEPINYTSEIVPTVFEEYYESGDVPLSGLGYELKKNFSFGAMALGGSLGIYSTNATLDDSTLQLIVPSVKATLYLDTLFDEPYIVPYASFGYSYFSYKEEYEDAIEIVEVSGETDNFFISFGAELQLDWLDKTADVSAYNSGLENTFIFVEGRMYMDQGIIRSAEDPDFSTDLYLAAGLRLEF